MRKGSSKPYADVDEVISRKVKKVPGGCWEWMGSINRDGYGQVGFRKKVWRVHRLVYLHLVGPIDSPALDHLCRNRRCCNPEHLEPVSHRENTMRGVSPIAQNPHKTHCAKGHKYSGENLGFTRLGARACMTCRREFSKKRRVRHAAKYRQTLSEWRERAVAQGLIGRVHLLQGERPVCGCDARLATPIKMSMTLNEVTCGNCRKLLGRGE